MSSKTHLKFQHIPALIAGGLASEKVKRPADGTWGELTASPKPSVRRGTKRVGVLGTMQSSPPSSYPFKINKKKNVQVANYLVHPYCWHEKRLNDLPGLVVVC